jgi:hypothetical protein
MGGKSNEKMDAVANAPAGTKRHKGIRVQRARYRKVKMSDAEHKNLTVEELVDVLFDIGPPE